MRLQDFTLSLRSLTTFTASSLPVSWQWPLKTYTQVHNHELTVHAQCRSTAYNVSAELTIPKFPHPRILDSSNFQFVTADVSNEHGRERPVKLHSANEITMLDVATFLWVDTARIIPTIIITTTVMINLVQGNSHTLYKVMSKSMVCNLTIITHTPTFFLLSISICSH